MSIKVYEAYRGSVSQHGRSQLPRGRSRFKIGWMMSYILFFFIFFYFFPTDLFFDKHQLTGCCCSFSLFVQLLTNKVLYRVYLIFVFVVVGVIQAPSWSPTTAEKCH
jgi:hypothetical protein